MSFAGGHPVRRTVLAGAFATLGLSIASSGWLATSAAAATTITITSGSCSGGGSAFCYSPESMTVAVNTPVVWSNMSGVAHTATSCTAAACPGSPASTGSNSFNVSIAAANGSTGSFTFTSPGVYYYYCAIHTYPLMHGVITVTAAAGSPPASATGSSGASQSSGPKSTPTTGASPGPLGGIAIAAGVIALAATAWVRRRSR